MEHQSSPLPGRDNFRWRIAIPMLLALIGAFLLIGCIYLPIPEHRVSSADKDFRDLLGNAGSHGPIRPHAITRAAVMKLLGLPDYSDISGRSVGYTLKTEYGLYVWPTCFVVQSSGGRVYAARLTFDDHDLLENWEMVHLDYTYGLLLNETSLYDHDAIELLNKHGPELMLAEEAYSQRTQLNGPQP